MKVFEFISDKEVAELVDIKGVKKLNMDTGIITLDGEFSLTALSIVHDKLSQMHRNEIQRHGIALMNN